MAKQKLLSAREREELLKILESRFTQNKKRHPGVAWPSVLERLEARPEKLWSLSEMERTGGEPDVTGQDTTTGEIVFSDCVAESPKGAAELVLFRRTLLCHVIRWGCGSQCVMMATVDAGTGKVYEPPLADKNSLWAPQFPSMR